MHCPVNAKIGTAAACPVKRPPASAMVAMVLLGVSNASMYVERSQQPNCRMLTSGCIIIGLFVQLCLAAIFCDLQEKP